MRGVAGEIKPPVLHRLHDVTPHRRKILLEYGAFGELPVSIDRETSVKFPPNPIVGIIMEVRIGRNLHIQASNFRGAHAQQGETAFVIRVDQFVRRRRRLNEYAEPSEWIRAVQCGEHARGNAWPADSVETVATGDEIAIQFVRLAVRCEAN